jgi:uncharacterized membrane protein YjjB (DUF3815 family)
VLTGSLKLVWAIFQALFIGFVQTLGSDLWLRLDSRSRAQRLAMIENITHTIYSKGLLAANWTAGNISSPIALSFVHILDPNTAYNQYDYIGIGCYRVKHWQWYLQGLKSMWMIPFVPTFACLLALWNLQALKSKKDLKNIVIMVAFGCASFAANKVGEIYIHRSVGSVLGAFSISLLGSVYSRLCNGYAFAAMVPGVLLLVPTGLIAVGGLAQNYSSNDDQFASGLNTGLAMIQSMCKNIVLASSIFLIILFLFFLATKVSIAITIGLCLAVAGWDLFMNAKGYLNHKRQDTAECFVF